jgi:DNA-binding MarR family transcriptional regulator
MNDPKDGRDETGVGQGQLSKCQLRNLTKMVGEVVESLEHFSGNGPANVAVAGVFEGAISLAEQRRATRNAGTQKARDVGKRLIGEPRIPEPDPRLLRRIIRQRQLRTRLFDSSLFADPAWDMLLELTAARGENVRISVTSLCIASGVPATTALRWIDQMTKVGLFERHGDKADRRRTYVTLTEKAAYSMARYFSEIDTTVARLI